MIFTAGAPDSVATLEVVTVTDDPRLILTSHDSHTRSGWLWHFKAKPTYVPPALLRRPQYRNGLLSLWRLRRMFQDRLHREVFIRIVVKHPILIHHVPALLQGSRVKLL